MAKKKFSKKAVAAKYGFRSGLELDISEALQSQGIDGEYEKHVINYIKPATNHKYHPDFCIRKKDGSLMYIESKGRWVQQDILKMQLIKEQHPELDIRLLFQNSENKIRKGSKTTYADKATKLGYIWADYKTNMGIPKEWLSE